MQHAAARARGRGSLLCVLLLSAGLAVATGGSPHRLASSQAGESELVNLFPGCNAVSSTWPNGTSPSVVALAIRSPDPALEIWGTDPASGRFLGWSHSVEQPPDLLLINNLDTLLICVRRSATLQRPLAAYPPPLPPQGVYLGIYQPDAPEDMTALTRFEQRVGKKVAIVSWYHHWLTDVNPVLFNRVFDHGAVPMVTWSPWPDGSLGVNQPDFSDARIASGVYDDYVRTWARKLAALRGPILLRYASEMNGDWNSWSVGVNGNTAQSYVDAWRHLHDIFIQEGATNVQWVWSPNTEHYNHSVADFTPMFPGDEYVDWVALDGYAWGGTPYLTFDQVFESSYQKITALSSRPVMLAEVGANEAQGDESTKADWIADALTVRLPSMPRLRAIVWFNRHLDAQNDMRIESSPAAEQAFATAVGKPYYLSQFP